MPVKTSTPATGYKCAPIPMPERVTGTHKLPVPANCRLVTSLKPVYYGRVCYAALREPGPPPRLWLATARSMWCKGPCLGEAPNQPGPKKNVFDSTPCSPAKGKKNVFDSTPCSPAKGHFTAEIA
jgi:hypothetical protein